MPDQNAAYLTGHLARDAEFRSLSSGTEIAELVLAHTDKWKNRNGEQQEHTSYFDLTVMGRSAEIIRKRNEERGEFVKGDVVQVDGGKLRQDRWETDDGQKRSKVKVQAFRVFWHGHSKAHNEAASEDRQPSGGQERRGQGQSPEPDPNDTIPF